MKLVHRMIPVTDTEIRMYLKFVTVAMLALNEVCIAQYIMR